MKMHEFNYHIEAVTDNTRYFSQPITKAAALREIRKLEQFGYYGIKLVIISKTYDNER